MTDQPKVRLNIPVSDQELTMRAGSIKAASVTPAQVEAFITSEHYFTAGDGVMGAHLAADTSELMNHGVSYDSQLDILTFCVLVLANGFTVHGISACADPKMFDAEIGKRLARTDAKNKIWALLGFQLRSQLALTESMTPPSYAEQATYLGSKIIHAVPMDRLSYCTLRGWELPADENGSDKGYLVEYADGGQANVAGFTGYVSWSPADVFDKAYKLLGKATPANA